MRRDRVRPFLPPAVRAGLGAAPRRVGLLGGSFNPAHEGHRHISVEALRHLGLDEVWWLVAPQNPLKEARGMDPLSERLAAARRAARHDRIRVTGIERDLGTRYTVDTLARLRALFPRTSFTWLMGADNLAQMPRWKRWPDIAAMAPIAVIDRPGCGVRALAGAVARRYGARRLRDGAVRGIAAAGPPAWCFLRCRLSPLSATAIRAARHP